MVTTGSITTAMQQARDRGVAYLLSQQRAHGAVGIPERDGCGPYYKTIWAFAAGGQPEAANRLTTWVRDNVQQDDGDFDGSLRGKFHDNNWPYPASWMLVGAQELGRYDVCRPGMRFLSTLQSRETGGFRLRRDDALSVQDVLNAGQAGNALLAAGNITDAVRAGEFLQMLWEAQPHPDRELYFVWKLGAGLRTEFPEERQYLHSIRVDRPRQPYFNSGMAAAFLVRLAMATGNRTWTELAKHWLEISFHTLDEMYETAQVGKVGWGAALIDGVTGEDRYRQLAERAGSAMLAQQTDSGGWDNTGGYTNDAVRTEVTAEFVVLLDEMCSGLAVA